MTAPPLFPGFDGLMTLSRREGVDIRPTLLRVLTDLYVQASAHSADEERQFVELTSRLIDQVDDATRAAVRARLAIYPATPAEIMSKLGLRRSHPGEPYRSRRDHRRHRPKRRRPTAPTEAQLRMASNLSMRPNDAAEISDMFFAANASERALILHNLTETPLKASARIPAARAERAIEIAGDGGVRRGYRKFHARDRRSADPAGADRDAGGQRSRRRAAGLRGAGARHAERGLPAGADVPQSRIRLVRAERLPAVTALRPADRTIRAGDARGMARLDHGGHPRQISPVALRRRTQPCAFGSIRDAPRGAARKRSGCGRAPMVRSPNPSAHAFARSRKCRPARSSVSTIQASGSKRISLARRSSTDCSGTGCGDAGANSRSAGRLSS